MTIPRDACVELQWWSNNALNLEKNILIPNPEFVLATDASTLGWGAVFGNCSTNGTWSSHEANLHINVLELKAVLYGLKSLVHVTNTHVKVLSDNTTAVCTINRMGTCHSNPCNAVVQLIWQWAISKNIWPSATHIPGVENILADQESRLHAKRLEWKLNPKIFLSICSALDITPNIDLFASRINFQLKPFVSYRPDPEAIAVDAFCLDWSDYLFYAFPPFAVIPQVLQKIISDKATGLLIVPDWPNQAWYPIFMIHSSKVISIPSSKDLLHLPSHPTEVHPLQNTLQLLASVTQAQ